MTSQQVQQLAADTYFPNVKRRTETSATPILDSDPGLKVPPAAIMTGEYDTPSLRPPDRRNTYSQDYADRLRKLPARLGLEFSTI
jgi:hypothetical protein